MAAPSVARSLGRPRLSGLAWRRARWGYVFIAPWLIGFVAVHGAPDGRHARLHVHQHQPRPGRAAPLRRPQELRRRCSATSRPGTSLAGHPQVRASWPCRWRSSCRSLVALMLHSRHLRGSGGFRVLFFLPYVVPFVAGVLIWRRHAQRRQRLGQRLPRGSSASRNPPDWLQDPTWIYSGLVIMGDLGHRGRDHRLPGRPQGHPDRAVRRRPDRRRRRLGLAPPHHHPDDVAGHLLHARARPSWRCSSTSSSRWCSRTGPVSRAARRSSTTSTSTRTSSRSRTCRTGRRSPGSCSRSRWSITLAPVPDRPTLGLLRRRGALSGGDAGGQRRRARHPGRRGAARGPARAPTAAPRVRGDGRRSFLLTLIAVARGRRVPVADAPLVHLRHQEHRPDHPGRLAALPGRSGDVRVPGRGAADPAGPDRRDDPPAGPASSRAASRARSSIRRTRTPRRSLWVGSWRTLEHQSGSSPRTGRTSPRSGT